MSDNKLALLEEEDPFLFKYDNTDNKKISTSLRKIEEAELYINDSAYSIRKIEKTCRKLADKRHIDLIAVDYLQLIRTDKGDSIVNRLKQLAREIHCPVVVMSRLDRSIDDRADHMPMMSDLRKYERLDCYADKVLFLYRDDYYNYDSKKRGEAEIILAKNIGPIGTVTLRHTEIL